MSTFSFFPLPEADVNVRRENKFSSCKFILMLFQSLFPENIKLNKLLFLVLN